MKKDGRGGGRVWLSSKWNIEVKEVSLNAHMKAEGLASVSRRIRAELTPWLPFIFLSRPVPPQCTVIRDSWAQGLPPGISGR